MHVIIPKYQINLRLPIYGKLLPVSIFQPHVTQWHVNTFYMAGEALTWCGTLIKFIIFQRVENRSFNQSFQSGRKVQIKDLFA